MSDLKEYIVTLKNRNDLDAFYEDMETPGGDLYIPNRAVECANRREVSRNTHYLLSNVEAEELKKDSRVMFVELTPEQRGIVVRPSFTQTGNFNKSGVGQASYRNWGLLRCVEGEQRANWGDDGTQNINATISVTTQGKNVDVVIVDGHFDPAHPEYAVNSDGTGGSRVVQYNWFQHRAGGGDYVYTPYTGTEAEEDNNHGAHVAGTACGSTQGWARAANIYNINPYGTNPNGNIPTFIFDYIRAFHASKSVNPVTARRNPTITNNSWGFSRFVEAREIIEVYYRNVLIPGPFTNEQLATYGLFTLNFLGVDYVIIEARVGAVEADIVDAVDDGIIVIGAAGNSSSTLGVPYDADWDNYITVNGETIYTSDLGTPGGAVKEGSTWDDLDPATICVGSIGTSADDSKSDFSNRGARIDIWAPGSGIQSSVNSGGISDGRNASYRQDVYSGTSMASPQVCGVLACALEIYPFMNNDQARAYLNTYSKAQVANPSNDLNNKLSLLDSPNRYLAHKQERPVSGNTYPKTDYFIRPSSGQMYPRTRIKK
jgi:hypothetical protein